MPKYEKLFLKTITIITLFCTIFYMHTTQLLSILMVYNDH